MSELKACLLCGAHPGAPCEKMHAAIWSRWIAGESIIALAIDYELAEWSVEKILRGESGPKRRRRPRLEPEGGFR